MESETQGGIKADQKVRTTNKKSEWNPYSRFKFVTITKVLRWKRFSSIYWIVMMNLFK